MKAPSQGLSGSERFALPGGRPGWTLDPELR